MSRPKPCDDDLRVARLVKAASDNGNRFRNMLSDIVCNVSILYSVHFEEIPFDVIRTAIISAISQAKLIDRPPTILEFNSMWNAEVSLLVKKPKRVHRVDKSLRSIVFGLFHDRRGKISHVARTAWLSIFGGVSDELGKPDVTVRQGVTSLSSSTADCWSFFHVRSRSEDAPVFRVVKRMFLPVPPLSDTQEPYLASVRPTQSAQITINPDIDAVMPDPPTTRTAHPVLPPAVVIVRKVTNPAPISALPDDRMPSVPVPVQPLWKAFITAISDAHYKSVYLGTDPDLGFGNDLEEEQASTGPPSADIEWSIHPGSLTFVANVLAAPCISKTTGLTVDIERDPKSKRIVSIVTNASPRLESFILSIGDKLLLEHPSNIHANVLRIKSTVGNRLKSQYDCGNAWTNFQKRKELLSWNLYNLRDQVQKLIVLEKVASGVPYINVADNLIADLSRLRMSSYVAAHADSVEDLTLDDDAGDDKSDSGTELFSSPID